MSEQTGPLHPIDAGIFRKIVEDSINSHLPPAGFDSLAASQEELRRLGFPRRPDAALRPAAYAAWRTMFAGPMEFSEFRLDIGPPARPVPRRILFDRSTPRQKSLNWSGAYLTPRDATVFKEVWGKFQVPTPQLPHGAAANVKYRCSTWIGFDGQRRYHRSTLPQIGTAQNIDPATGGATTSFSAWWQWWVRDAVANAPVPLSAPAIHAGDLIMCFMQVDSTREEVSFGISNLTTNRSVQFTQQAPPKGFGRRYKVSGATAEWVTERSADPPDPTPLQLPDYGTVNFHDCGATAINLKTGVTVERSLSAARLIDMYMVEKNPDRTRKISIAKSLGASAFLTHFR
ncbi:hypothetical protein JQ581_28740 [Bradyrhizobium liaoningense]|uniref:G1 family glutamic endopeptidase n=1 Tax=Bradyrhizobium liaoningense TaxID=43992 RepID=UPI001BAC2BAF|nr:G1 family glutamic endopeptidase [Bradyrhizobium liaoningense]MBR0740928.1 hypothetical protein [Bradyrhizobium liaoningense]